MTDRARHNELRVFTRYPIPGETKTRLIPALGEEAAADLQRRMTEFLIQKLSTVASDETRITLCWSGAREREVRDWIEPISQTISFAKQTGADLGERMRNAFQASFRAGHRRTVIIGTDCPGITPDTVRNSFQKLENNDLVLGPAQDGGYYLIGLSSFQPELFSDINWGSKSVFDQTIQRAEQLELGAHTLQPRRDVDRPDDLPLLDDINLPE
jgi:rSAM/selenodomain-associated transferase 1